jgi:tRNA threonylcarbamoyl adenosine modification protein YeaZ
VSASRVLLLDTSVRGRVMTAVAVTADGAWQVEWVDIRDAELDTGLPARIAATLGDPRGIDGVVVTLGPGSYTGVRAGIAAAAGLTAARSLPLHGLSTIELVAAGAPPGSAVAWAGIDAGRGGLYVARVLLDAASGRPVSADDATRVEAASWAPPADEPLVMLETLDGTRMTRAVAIAVAVAMDRPALDLSAVEPATVAHGQAAERRV